MTTEVMATVDSELVAEASPIFAEIGLTLSDAMRLLLRRTVAEHSVPLDLFTPNAETVEAMEDARAGRNMISARSIDDLFAQLHADD